MKERFKVEVIECDDKKYVMIMDTHPDSCIGTYLINHENFSLRKQYCEMLVEKLNNQDNEIIKYKHNICLDNLLDIRNFIE